MSQPYSIQEDVLNQVLTKLLTEAGWDLVPDVLARIQEGDAEIDSRLGALGYALPFTTNPPLLKSLSILYARYACFRDLYTGNSPSQQPANAEASFKNEFEEKFQKLEDGWMALLDATGATIPSTKFDVTVAQNTAAVDNHPGKPISAYMSDVDVKDGLNPSDGSLSDEGGRTNDI